MAVTKAKKQVPKPKKLITKKTKVVGFNPFTWLAWFVETTANMSRRVQGHRHHAQKATNSISSLYNDWSHSKGELIAQKRDRRRAERGKVRCVNCQGDGNDVMLSPDEQAEHFSQVHGISNSTPSTTVVQTSNAPRKKNKIKTTATSSSPNAAASGGAAMAAAMTAAVTGKTSGPVKATPDPRAKIDAARKKAAAGQAALHSTRGEVTNSTSPSSTTSKPVIPIRLGGSGTKTSADGSGVNPGERSPDGVWVAPTEAISRDPNLQTPLPQGGERQLTGHWVDNGWPNDGEPRDKPAVIPANSTPGTVTSIRPAVTTRPVTGSSTQAVEVKIAEQNANDKERKRAARRYRGRHRSDGTTPTVADARGTGSQQSQNWRAAMANLDIANQALTWAQNPPESWEEEMADAQQAADEFRALADAVRTRAERLIEAHNIAPDCVVPYEDAANILSQVSDHIMEVSTLIQAKYGELKEAAERGEVPRLEWLAAGSGATKSTGV